VTTVENTVWSEQAVFHTGGFKLLQMPFWAKYNPSRNLQTVPSHAKVWCGMISTTVGGIIIFPVVDTVKYLEALK
jgi:hypothetical protein